MTALFMLFADAAMASTLPPSQAGTEDDIVVVSPAASRGRPWSPRVDDWYDDTPTCPYAYDEEIAGFGRIRIGGRCGDRDDRLADPWRE